MAAPPAQFQTAVLVSPGPGRASPFRSIVLKPAHVPGTNYSLVFDAAGSDRATCRFQPTASINLANYTLLAPRAVFGCLGLLEINNDLFVALVTDAVRVCVLRGCPILRVTNVSFYSLLNATYDNVGVSLLDDDPSTQQQGTVYHPCSAIAKILCAGSFYISPLLDFTRNMQKFTHDIQMGDISTDLFEKADDTMFWNKHMLASLLDIRDRELSPDERDALDRSGILIPCIQGYVGQVPVTVGGSQFDLTVVSRLSCKRAGTRLLSRGVDDDGNVSNHVETEMIISAKDGRVSSFVQMRGSVPLFWEQTGIQMTHKITIARGLESAMPAFSKHMESILERFKQVCVINLLSQKPQSTEQQLSELFDRALHTNKNVADRLQYVNYDFHTVAKRDGYDQVQAVISHVKEYLDNSNYFLVDANGDPVLFQDGIVRTNCLDCLDRTNVIQTHIARYIIEKQFHDLGARFSSQFELEQFNDAFNGIWADNGDWLSKIYAGTGALKSSYTRKGKSTLLGFLDDAVKSTARFYINNFSDKGRQDAIDYMLGKNGHNITMLLRNPLHEAVNKALIGRINEFSSVDEITVFVGTWNVNGKFDIASNVSTWIQPTVKLKQPPHIYSFGIQELMELNATYITTDSMKIQAEWEQNLLFVINRHSQADYVTLRSANLGALGLFLFARKDCVSKIRNVHSSMKRTGLGGIAANKGGIGISLTYNDSPLALITAHFASGQQAIPERNNDFMTITSELMFQGRRIYEHDLIVWFGDFNYRINEENHIVRDMVNRGAIPQLLECDQLKQQQRANATFVGYNEGEIEFNPTYKYDNGTNNYDSGEKMRTPAWTDRVLYKGSSSHLLEYTRAECLVSDHRPVRAVFKVSTRIIDKEKKSAIQSSLYEEYEHMKVAPPLPIRGNNQERKSMGQRWASDTSGGSTISHPSSFNPKPLSANSMKQAPHKPPRSQTSASLSGNPTSPLQSTTSLSNSAPRAGFSLLDDDPVDIPPSVDLLTNSSHPDSDAISVRSAAMQPTVSQSTLQPALVPMQSQSAQSLMNKFEKLNMKHGLSPPRLSSETISKKSDPTNDPFADIASGSFTTFSKSSVTSDQSSKITPASLTSYGASFSQVTTPALVNTSVAQQNFNSASSLQAQPSAQSFSGVSTAAIPSANSNITSIPAARNPWNSASPKSPADSIPYIPPSGNVSVTRTPALQPLSSTTSATLSLPNLAADDPWRVQPLSGSSAGTSPKDQESVGLKPINSNTRRKSSQGVRPITAADLASTHNPFG